MKFPGIGIAEGANIVSNDGSSVNHGLMVAFHIAADLGVLRLISFHHSRELPL